MTKDLHNLSNEEIYEKYEQLGIYSKPERFPWVRELIVELKNIEKSLQDEPQLCSIVLDVGTGGSATLFGILKNLKACRVTSVDLDKMNITLSRKKLREKGIKASLYEHSQQDAKSLGVGSDKADIVSSILTVHEISAKNREYEDKARTILELDRVCSVERFVIIVDTVDDFRGIWAHNPEALADSRISFITGKDLSSFMRVVFPKNQISTRDFEAEGGTAFFIVAMRKLSDDDISDISSLSDAFIEDEAKGNDTVKRMMLELRSISS